MHVGESVQHPTVTILSGWAGVVGGTKFKLCDAKCLYGTPPSDSSNSVISVEVSSTDTSLFGREHYLVLSTKEVPFIFYLFFGPSSFS